MTCLSAFSISPTLLAMVGFDNGWYWTATAVETVAFIACLTFIASGVYGRRNTVGKP
ncbi:MAG: hypothetical protein U5K75_00405 [Ahrensia sp.]|nr:hypothetical protein [Ahrensia sp.]